MTRKHHFAPISVTLLLCFLNIGLKAEDSKLFSGFDGGMLVHTGYLSGNFSQINRPVSGMPFGIGGVVRLHLNSHWRIGGEGYVSTLPLLSNGSYSKFGWGGLLCDFYWTLGRFAPYAGITLGGGANTSLLILGNNAEDWKPLDDSYFNKRRFFAIDPFIGCDYILSETFHLTLKADWLSCISGAGRIPSGPRLYFGFIFCH